MIVSHEHRFIFLKTRKTAGTSVEIALSSICGERDIITPITPEDEELRSRTGRGPQNHQSPPLPLPATNHSPARKARTIVGEAVWADYTKVTVERNPWDQVVSSYYWAARTNPDAPTFDVFVRRPRVAKLADTNARIYRIGGELIADRVLRFESLAEDLTQLWDELGLPGQPELPRAKSGVRPAVAYQDLYDDEARELVRTLFAASIRDFGYDF
ncbi:MAG: sulfotransferase family 2 domain-containing protein [Nocardioides sp.]